MIIRLLFRSAAMAIALTALAACSGMAGPEVAPADTTTTDATVSDSTPLDSTTTVDTPPTNPAVVALLDNAQSNASAGRLPTAIAAVERALRIEPKNPLLWQKLAMLKLQKGEYQQAENFAARSNSWAGANKPVQARNWRLISEARSLRGDNAGAKAALARAKALEQ